MKEGFEDTRRLEKVHKIHISRQAAGHLHSVCNSARRTTSLGGVMSMNTSSLRSRETSMFKSVDGRHVLPLPAVSATHWNCNSGIVTHLNNTHNILSKILAVQNNSDSLMSPNTFLGKQYVLDWSLPLYPC